MNETHVFLVAKAFSTTAIASGAFLVAYGYAREQSYPLRGAVDRYTAHLDRMLRLCFLKADATRIVRGQGLVMVAGLGAYAALGVPALLAIPAIAAVAPSLHLASARRERSTQFTAQTDTFLVALANSLKAVPNVGAALAGMMPVLQNPIKEEIALALNEMRVGNSVDQALLNTSARAQSAAFDGALSALLIGRQVGGDLPKILETTASTIREMNRLEGVVRSKTSESRAQLWVLASFPVGIVVLFSLVSPGFFDPLEHTVVGKVVSGVALTMWLSAIALARQLSKVDL